MIQHIVMMKFKPAVTPADIEQLEAMLNSLPDKIIEIQVYEFGKDIVRGERSYDFALVSLFANLDALGRYQQHPEHQKVVAKLQSMCEQIVAVDFETTPPVSRKENQ